MIRAILTIININISQKINALLYFIKKIPLIKGLLKNLNYSFIGFKKFLSVIGIIYNIVAGPIGFGLLFYAAIYLPANLDWIKVDSLNAIMFFIFIFFFLSKFVGSDIMEANRETFIIVKQMKMNPKTYGISNLIWKKSRSLFSKSLVLALVFKFVFHKNPLSGINLGISITMFEVIVEAGHLALYKRTGFTINKFNKIRIALMLGGVASTYAIVIFTPIPEMVNLFGMLTNIYTAVILSVFGIISFIYLLKYDRYWDILNEGNKLDTFKDMQEAAKDINFEKIKLKDKDFNDESLKENDALDKEGYDYLNYIFFKRHKRVVLKPMIIKSLLVVAVFIGIFLADRFFIAGFAKETADDFIDDYSLFIFVVYAMCNATAIMKSLFYNCDRSLLRYGFYKEGDALLKMFFLRLKKILIANMVPIILLCLGMVQVVYFNTPERILETIPMVIATLLVAVIFSVHYIFIYYILQPFTTDLKTKSPLYTVINMLVYLAAYLLILLGWSAAKILPYIIAVSVIYIPIAIRLIYTKAPKTFRVK